MTDTTQNIFFWSFVSETEYVKAFYRPNHAKGATIDIYAGQEDDFGPGYFFHDPILSFYFHIIPQ